MIPKLQKGTVLIEGVKLCSICSETNIVGGIYHLAKQTLTIPNKRMRLKISQLRYKDLYMHGENMSKQNYLNLLNEMWNTQS